MRHIAKRVLQVFLVVIVGGAILFKSYTSSYYHADEAAIQEIAKDCAVDVVTYQKDTLVFIPKDYEHVKAGIVFYPGGKVEYTAYEGLMYELADRGFVCVLPRMPENLAFLDVNAAEGLVEQSPVVTDWYLAGHSLGGVAASTYLGKQIDAGKELDYDGLIMCASYSTTDFSNTDLRLLSLYGSEDEVLNMENYENNKVNWPADSAEYIIDGGIHSYFGCYGIQSGDGEPKVTNEGQLELTADLIEEWIMR